MIFYGTNAKSIKNGKIINVQCPNCEQNTSMTYSVFGKYAHIYWVPFIPYKKVSITECDYCKRTFESGELPQNIVKKLNQDFERGNTKYPIWMYSGASILAGVLIFTFFMNMKEKEDEANYIKEPKIGDLYHYKTESGNYSLMKVHDISKDSILLLVNEMETNLMSGVKEINLKKHYKEVYGFSRKEIEDLYKEKNIYEINRD